MTAIFKQLGIVAGALLLTVAAYGQTCPMDNMDALIEQVLVLRMTQELGLDTQTTVEVMEGYAVYREKKDERAKIAGELSEAIAAGSGVGAKLDALRNVDKEIAAFLDGAMDELGSNLSEADEAKFYLFVTGIDALVMKAKQQMMAPPAPPALAAAAPAAPCAAAAPTAAAAPAAASDQELIKATVLKVKEALESKNIDMLLETFAEDFEHPEVGGKEEARDMLEMGIEMGYADEGQVSLDDMEIKIEDDGTASVYPVDLSGPPGSVAVELIMGKRGDKWLITTVEVDGI